MLHYCPAGASNMDQRPNQPPSPGLPSSSSSLPPHQWINQPARSSSARLRRFDGQFDESMLAQRTSALRQLNRHPHSHQRHHRQGNSAGSRSSLATQPVVVRSYSAGTDVRSTMSPRSLAENRPPEKLPPVEDFGIDGILRAIEPDIQSTLDAIAEICGRSKLSLANEYGSHRPPLGEIRAPARPVDNGLLPVEEASSSNERLVDENVVIAGDDISTLDGRDPYPSAYDYEGNMPFTPGAIGHPSGWGDSNFQGSLQTSNPLPIREIRPEEQTGSNATLPSFPWSLLGSYGAHGGRGNGQSIQTQPVISEVHLDVQADGTYDPPDADQMWMAYGVFMQSPPEGTGRPNLDKSMLQLVASKLSFLSDLRALLGRVRGANEGTESHVGLSAEGQLREVLLRQNIHLMAANERDATIHAEAA